METEVDKEALLNKEIKCERCKKTSKAKDYKGNIFEIQCPKCKKKYEPKDYDLRNCIYLKDLLNESNPIINQEINYSPILEIRKSKRDNEEIKFRNINSPVNGIEVLNDCRIAACFDNGSINIYNRYGDLLIQKNYAHSDIIWTITLLRNNILASGGKNDIKIWKITEDNLNLINDLGNVHGDYLNKIIVINNESFASCSRDGKINIYHTPNDYYIVNHKSFNCHSSYINCIIKIFWDENMIVSGSNGERNLKFWIYKDYYHLNLKKCFNGIYSTSYNNSLLEVDHNLLVGEDKGIRIFSKINGKIANTGYYEDYLGWAMSFLNLNNNYFICGRLSGSCCIFKVEKNENNENRIILVNNFRDNLSSSAYSTSYPVCCLSKENNFISKVTFYTSSRNNTINSYYYYYS